MRLRKSPGHGSVDRLGNGRWRARLTLATAERESLGTYATQEDAERVLAAALAELVEGNVAPVGGMTLRALGAGFFRDRELGGDIRDVDNEKRRWRSHVEPAPFIDLPVSTLTAPMVFEWREALRFRRVQYPYKHPRNGQRISAETCQRVFVLLRTCLDEAVARGILGENPARGLRRQKRGGRTDEPWTFLEPGEQANLLGYRAVAEVERWLVTIVMHTGMRPSELAYLRLEDVHADAVDPHVVVRFSRKGKAPKNNRIRRVQLFGPGRDALRAWLGALSRYAPTNPLRLAFPCRMDGAVLSEATGSLASSASTARRSHGGSNGCGPRESPATFASTIFAIRADRRWCPAGGVVDGRSRRSRSTSGTRASSRHSATRTSATRHPSRLRARPMRRRARRSREGHGR
jgi:integrase